MANRFEKDRALNRIDGIKEHVFPVYHVVTAVPSGFSKPKEKKQGLSCSSSEISNQLRYTKKRIEGKKVCSIEIEAANFGWNASSALKKRKTGIDQNLFFRENR